MKPLASWVAVLTLTVCLTGVSACQSFARYREFRSGWSWDLAYYNQWYWSLTRGDRLLTVRPIGFSNEGPSVFKTNYLSPMRYALVPLHRLWPDPRLLLLVQCVVFWWVVPASYGLVRAEAKSNAVALSTAALVPMTPLAWPLVWNDFRELQVAVPFVVWAVHGWRSRHRGLTAVGIGGMLACRQEYAMTVALLTLLPAREPEDVGRWFAWTQGALLIGLGWFFVAFLGYLEWMIGPHAPESYLAQFGGPRATIPETLETAADFLLVGMASWAVLALIAPRAAVMAVPFVWNLANGRWALRLIAKEEWHAVRYAAPMFALVLAAGLIGYARVWTWLAPRRRAVLPMATLWVIAAVGMLAAGRDLQGRMDRIPRTFSPEEAREVWRWTDRVGPDDGVVADYVVAAPLSSRRLLYSYILDINKPRGYPVLGPEIHWVFMDHSRLEPKVLVDQGFEIVHQGAFLWIYRRVVPSAS